jgi:hypothetical protein
MPQKAVPPGSNDTGDEDARPGTFVATTHVLAALLKRLNSQFINRGE